MWDTTANRTEVGWEDGVRLSLSCCRPARVRPLVAEKTAVTSALALVDQLLLQQAQRSSVSVSAGPLQHRSRTSLPIHSTARISAAHFALALLHLCVHRTDHTLSLTAAQRPLYSRALSLVVQRKADGASLLRRQQCLLHAAVIDIDDELSLSLFLCASPCCC